MRTPLLLLCFAVIAGCSKPPASEREQVEAPPAAHRGKMDADGSNVHRDDNNAVEGLQKAAAKGDANAQFALAEMYADGRGVPRDKAKASECFQKAADMGDARAEDVLGSMYLFGRGVPKGHTRKLRFEEIEVQKGGWCVGRKAAWRDGILHRIRRARLV